MGDKWVANWVGITDEVRCSAAATLSDYLILKLLHDTLARSVRGNNPVAYPIE